MFCYIWSYKAYPKKCKLGEHWVEDGRNPEKEVYKRVRQQLDTSKHLLDIGEVTIDWFGDVTEYAKKYNRFRPHGKVDDHIRGVIGYRADTRTEFHDLASEEMQIRVMRLLTHVGQKFPEAHLSTSQYNAAVNILSAINDGKRTILAELCPRFGKTIWAGAIGVELDVPIIIITSYIHTSFASFEKDLARFGQFQKYLHVDMKDDDALAQIEQAQHASKPIVVYLSMHSSVYRAGNVEFLFNLPSRRLVIIDEADYGMHRQGQARPLIGAREDDDVVILMTGTNGDRATSEWKIDYHMSVTYPELLMEKKVA